MKMTQLYHSFKYPSDNEDELLYTYRNTDTINEVNIESTFDFKNEIRYLIDCDETKEYGILEVYPFGAVNEPEDLAAVVTYLLEEKFLENTGSMLDVLEDSIKENKFSIRTNIKKGYLVFVEDKKSKNGVGYLRIMTEADLENHFKIYKDEIIQKAIKLELNDSKIN